MNKKIIISLTILVLVTLACNLATPGNTTQQAPGGEPQQGGTPPSQPVTISEGLASLNSYRITVTIISRGPTPEDSSTTVIETQRSQDLDARYTHMTQTVAKQGEAEQSISEYTLYRIGYDQCSNSGDEWSWTSMAPNQAEMIDIMMNMFNFTPIIDNPTFMAEETVNGIPSNHFSFKVTGLGVESGAEVTANQGDYWLAVDGQYVVKYSLVLETVLDPQTNLLHMETLIDMNDINQPVNIAFPQACLDASLVTPEP
jgi:hypothetical protein